MKKVIYVLFLSTLCVVSSWGQCANDPITVNIIANQTDDCTYTVLVGMNLPATPFQLQNFDLTILFGGVNSGSITECHFQDAPVFCNAGSPGISLYSLNSGTSDLYNGFTLAEFETDGCLTFDPSNFYSDDPCIVLGNVTGFCSDPPQPTGPACVEFNYLDEPNCEVDVTTAITAVSGCTEQTVGVPPGEGGVCFDTFDGECVDIEMDEGACGCVGENVITTIDMIAIQQHILGLTPLNASFPLALADVNCDGDITAIDLLEIRRHILGLPSGVENDCSNIGECVMVDNKTGEIITEICPFEQLDVSLGVFGDADGSCDPCGDGSYNFQEDPNSGSFLSVSNKGEFSFLAFEEDVVFNSIILELPVGKDLSPSQVKLSSKLNVDYFEKNIVNDKLHILLFSHMPLTVRKGDALLDIKSKQGNLIGKLEAKTNFLINSDGAVFIQNQLSEPKLNLGNPSFEYYINSSQLTLSHNLTGDEILVRIVNVSGQVLYEKNLDNYDGFINIEAPVNENIYFVSLITESGIITQPILNIK